MFKTLLPYQSAFVDFALGAPGTLLADEMGLGKTVQAIALINAMKARKVLVIAPAGLCLNWHNELDDWLEVRPGQHVNVVSYNRAASLGEQDTWDLVIVDEAHYIKNPASQRSQLVQGIAKRCERTLLMTGTPIENRPVELWPLLQIVARDEFDPDVGERPGVITSEQRASHPGEGPNFWAFAKRYCGLKRSHYRSRGKARSAFDFSGATNLLELNKRLRRSCMVRRLKKDVLPQLPDKRRQVIVLESRGIDDSHMLSDLDDSNYNESVRRLVADKVLFSEYSKKRHEQALKKVGACIDFIENALDQSEKIIVFAHHQDVIRQLYDDLTAILPDGEFCVEVTGATHVADRGAAVQSFMNDPRCRVFIGSIGAAGVGITLTASSHVIFCELDPVPGRMSQAEDRAHRIGQKHCVLVQHLVYDKSLCARMAKILVKKQDVINKVLDAV